MQEFDGPVGKVGSSVKNQGKQEYNRLCVVCKKKKKTCVLAKGQNKGRENGVRQLWRLACTRVISGSVLRKTVLHLVSANQSRSPRFHAQASNSDWRLFRAAYCAAKK